MNVFESLIEELRGENLLENTVEEQKNSTVAGNKFDKNSESTSLTDNKVLEADSLETDIIEIDVDSVVEYSEQNAQSVAQNDSPETIQTNERDEKTPKVDSEVVTVFPNENRNNSFNQEESPKATTGEKVNQTEFFRNRATNEVLALQMVEHVLAGVEREVLNISHKLYDELPVKKALHDFLQISVNVNSPEHAQAEFQLMQETESWYSALTQRDKNIKVGHLRRFCENSRPPLSSQALTSLARFYRNAPYSEPVRSKFDLILTRLFSKEVEKGKRTLTFSRSELSLQIGELYAEWASIPFYSADEDDSGIFLAALKMEDFITEAEAALSFDELVESDFFNRLRVFKESTQENFFAPLFAATAVEANIRIGNRYAELFEKLRENANPEMLEEKYGSLHEQTISEVVCKTFLIKDLIGERVAAPAHAQPEKFTPAQSKRVNTDKPKVNVFGKKKNKKENKLFRVNKWLLALTLIVVLGTLGLYVWVESVSEEIVLSTNVKNVNLDNSSLKEHIQTARISSETFYAIVLPSWDALPREKKEEFLSKALLMGSEKGYSRVNLINRQGKTVGFASPEKIEISNP